MMARESSVDFIRHSENKVFLMAEDNPSDVEIVSEMLRQAFKGACSIVCVDCYDKIVEAVEEREFRALILDMNLPGPSGVKNITHLSEKYPDLPIVVLTGQQDLSVAVESIKEGALDYLTKNNITPEVLARSLEYAVDQKLIESKLKEALDESTYRNVQLEAMVRHDPLTGLPNRSYFHDASTRILHRADRAKKQVALLFFDLNGFKRINDTYGHLIGDELLKQMSRRLENVVRDTDFLSRLGGDEFVIITDCLDSREQIHPLINRVLSVFDQPFVIEDHSITTAASIGVSFYPLAKSLDQLVKQADCAMYEAKSNHNHPLCFFTDSIANRISKKEKIENELDNAIANSELSCCFQPIVSTSKDKVGIMEALVRWSSPVIGRVPPSDFIPLADSKPVANSITWAVISDVADLYHGSISKGREISIFSINVTASQLAENDFIDSFLDCLIEKALPVDAICIELTERQIVQCSAMCRDQLQRLRAEGVKVALDDFSTDHSSVMKLLSLPLDMLKLDRAFIDHLDLNKKSQAVIAGIVEMAHRLGIEVVAEGIERKEEYRIAVSLGCDYVQGFYIAQPMQPDKAVSFYGLNAGEGCVCS
ncbi:GGDEF domain-containing response regulator [Marinobacterium jannaschii]|uniref:GGDEF domain-containing response regulator n=1 Tax=Marinobacterium jannaschii TaxID=64970 RepID=UPI0004878006|nr:GGDEF domain-containing response regulator [Marinobacterium jannaschii]